METRRNHLEMIIRFTNCVTILCRCVTGEKLLFSLFFIYIFSVLLLLLLLFLPINCSAFHVVLFVGS